MADLASINNIYNYYLTTYAPKTDSKFDAHKKSELRNVYNSMVKVNKDAPLYLVDKSQDTKAYVVGLKENARALHNTIASLGGLKEDELLSKKVAFSSDDSVASVTFIGSGKQAEKAPEFDIEVVDLAKTQVNRGKYLPQDIKRLADRTYSFDVSTNGLNYEFQYSVNSEDTNRSVQDKLVRLINSANIGLNARVDVNANNHSALIIESKNTGTPANGREMFEISDNNTSLVSGSVDYFGLSNVTTHASNSKFVINGMEREASGNLFTVENMYEINLNRVSNPGEEPVKIGVRADLESMAVNVSKLIDGYNKFIDIAGSYTEKNPLANNLVSEMRGLADSRGDDLKGVGISINDDGHISVDKNELMKDLDENNASDKFNVIQGFAGSMLSKTDQVAINPMNYANKVVVAYKNPGHNFTAPYVTSNYAGMLFNSYC